MLVAIIGFGFFLRSYHFSDWLHFELDQARDARIVDDGLRGDFFDLPLLGPKAGGTTLRLPPAFYYLEYWSAFVFGGTPAGIAVLGMLLSTASIGVFFLLLRRYFSLFLASSLTLLFAVSEFFVMYGRFAWNPNLIPFFLFLNAGTKQNFQSLPREHLGVDVQNHVTHTRSTNSDHRTTQDCQNPIGPVLGKKSQHR